MRKNKWIPTCPDCHRLHESWQPCPMRIAYAYLPPNPDTPQTTDADNSWISSHKQFSVLKAVEDAVTDIIDEDKMDVEGLEENPYPRVNKEAEEYYLGKTGGLTKVYFDINQIALGTIWDFYGNYYANEMIDLHGNYNVKGKTYSRLIST